MCSDRRVFRRPASGTRNQASWAFSSSTRAAPPCALYLQRLAGQREGAASSGAGQADHSSSFSCFSTFLASAPSTFFRAFSCGGPLVGVRRGDPGTTRGASGVCRFGEGEGAPSCCSSQQGP